MRSRLLYKGPKILSEQLALEGEEKNDASQDEKTLGEMIKVTRKKTPPKERHPKRKK